MTDQEIYKSARKRVKAKREFYSHLMTWLMFSAFFLLLNIFTSNHFWAIFPILGWGIAVAIHALRIFSASYGDDWEEREIQKEIRKIRKLGKNTENDEFV